MGQGNRSSVRLYPVELKLRFPGSGFRVPLVGARREIPEAGMWCRIIPHNGTL